ncbi:MAG: VCBS repeat-containing protein [Planctomycetota bacterium]
MSARRIVSTLILGAWLLSSLPSCGRKETSQPTTPSAQIAKEEPPFEIAAPFPALRIPQEIELLSESLTNAFQVFANKVFIRDWSGVAEFLHPEFRGQDPFGAPRGESAPLALGAVERHFEAAEAPVVDKAGFLASFEGHIGGWRRLEESLWKVRAAEFERADRPTWGRVQFAAHMVGITTDTGRELIELQGLARVQRVGKGWQVSGLQLTGVATISGGRELFTDVTRAAGVHHEGVRYGRPGNDSDGWNGIACHDVNGDGIWDVFVPSPDRSFLYLGQPGGGFTEAAAEAGLATSYGGTTPLFFDFENDGDPDLLVGHVGWRDIRNKGGGQSLRAYRNDGSGHFEEVTEQLGLEDVRVAAFGLTALDGDGDGFLDVYVSAYGRMGYLRNDSWIEASNGESDLYLRNIAGARFQDQSKAAGISDRGWSYGGVSGDFDEDGDPDVYVVTTFGSNLLWINRGDGTFENLATDRGVSLRGNSMGVSVGDPNRDGHLDLFLTNPSSNTGRRVLARFEEDKREGAYESLARMAGGNLLLEGNGKGGFRVVEKAGGAGSAGWAWGQAVVDLDLDGNQDVYCVNGFVTGDIPRDT